MPDAGVHHALHYIAQLPLDAARNIALHSEIDVNFTALISALRSALNSSHSSDPLDTQLLANIVSSEFMGHLLAQRARFRIVYQREDFEDTTDVAVCWVDDLLAAIGDLICKLIQTAQQTRSVPAGLASFCSDEKLRAATQLPDSWAELAAFIESTDISHGSRRLVTTLLYGACVLRPLLDPAQCKVDNLNVIARAAQARLDHWWSAPDERLQSLEIAMLVSLFAQDDYERAGSMSPRLVPHTSNIMKHVVLTLLSSSETDDLVADARAVLLEASSVVPWAWTFWRDSDTNGPILGLTAAWIGLPSRATLRTPQFAAISYDIDKHRDACAALGAVLATPNIPVDQQARLCELLAELVEDHPDGVQDATFARACDLLVQELRATVGSVQACGAVLRLLSCVSCDRIKRSLEPVSKWWLKVLDLVTLYAFPRRRALSFLLDNVIFKPFCSLLANTTPETPRKLAVALDFAALLCRDDCRSDQPTSRPHKSLNKPLQAWLVRHGDLTVLRSALQLWSLLELPEVVVPAMWDKIQDNGHTDVLLTGSLIQYVARHGKLHDVDREEIFDFLRDAVLLRLIHHSSESNEHEPFLQEHAISLSARLLRACFAAIRATLLGMDHDEAQFSLQSPLTEILVSELSSMLREDVAAEAWRAQLADQVGRRNIDQLLRELRNAGKRVPLNAAWTRLMIEPATVTKDNLDLEPGAPRITFTINSFLHILLATDSRSFGHSYFLYVTI